MTITLKFGKTDYSEASAFEEADLIRRQEMEQGLRIFKGLYMNALNYDKEFASQSRPESHNNMSIFAGRGEGKSSFLLTLLKRIREEYDDCLCLTPIDPSHIESKQHPFVNILAAIQEKVDEKINTNDLAETMGQSYDEFLSFQKCYTNVLNGLHIVDGIGSDKPYDGWDDDNYISLQGMMKAKASNNLERNFHEYIDKALQILKKKAMVIAFDDIDTDFKKGFDILEVIRKYLTTPKIIAILTGDQTLYTKLVRKAHWEFFDTGYLKKEEQIAGKSKEEFSLMIDQLENQYMVKILKPENRVVLQSLREFLDAGNNELLIDMGEGEDKSLMSIYEGILNDLGAKSSAQPKLVRFMTGLTLRIQIRILTLRYQLLKQGYTGKQMADTLTLGLMSIFSTDIYQVSDNAKALINGVPVYTIEMLNLLQKNNCLNVGTSFTPETGISVLDKVLLAVGLKFDQYLTEPGNRFLIFDYWLRLCYMHFLLVRLGERNDEKAIDKLLSYNRLNTDAGLIKGIGLSQAYFNSSFLTGIFRGSHTASMPGTVSLGVGVPVSLSEKNDVLPLMALVGTLDAHNVESVCLSIYHLMGILSEFMRFCRYNPQADLGQAVAQMLKLGQYRNYIEPLKKEPDLGRSDKSKDWSYLSNTAGTKILEDLAARMFEWQKKNKKLDISVQQLDRIFTRFYYTVVHIEEQDRYTNVGAKFNDIIISLINAALVESAIEEGIGDVNLNNIGYIETIFINNWQIMHRQWKKREHTFGNFAHWLSTCPLLCLFINPMLLNLMKNHHDDDSQLLSQVLSYGYDLSEKNDIEKRKLVAKKEEEKHQTTLVGLNIIRNHQRLLEEVSSLEASLQFAEKNEKAERAENLRNELSEKKNNVKQIEDTYVPFKVESEYYGEYVPLSIDDESLDMIYEETATKLAEASDEYKEYEEQYDAIDGRIASYSQFVKDEYSKVAAQPQTRTSLYTLYSTIPLMADED